MDPLGIEHVIDTVNAQTIPLLEKAVQRQVDRLPALIAAEIDRAMLQESNIISGVLLSAQEILNRIDAISARYEVLLARLDGATVTLALRKEGPQ